MDILCRFNTHKFMILLPNTLEENAIALCNDLKKCANAYEFSFKSSHINEPILTFSTQAYQVGEPLDEWLNRIQQ